MSSGSPGNAAGHQVSTETHVPIAITLPIMRTDNAIQFIFPREYTSVDMIPVPMDQGITIRSMPLRVVGVLTFYGHAPRSIYSKKVQQLEELLKNDGFLPKPGEVREGVNPTMFSSTVRVPSAKTSLEKDKSAAAKEGGATHAMQHPSTAVEGMWTLARYHPHFTLPAFRRNEVWVDLDPSFPAVAQAIQEYHFERNTQRVEGNVVAQAGEEGGVAGEKAT